MHEFEQDNPRGFEQLLSKVRTTLGLEAAAKAYEYTEISSVMHSRPDVEMEGTFGKVEASSTNEPSDINEDRPIRTRESHRDTRRLTELEIPIIRKSCSRGQGRLDTLNKENCHAHHNLSGEMGKHSDKIGKPSQKSALRLMDSCRPSTLGVNESAEMMYLQSQLQLSKDKELQWRLECERLNRELTKLHTEKEMLYKQFERKCRQFVELTSQPEGRKQASSKDRSNSLRSAPSQDVLSLTSELREARFIIEQLKLENGRIDYLQSGQPVAPRIAQLEDKVSALLSEKFALEEKLNQQQTTPWTQFMTDSRVKALRDALQFWIRKSRRIEEQAYQAIYSLRLDVNHLKSDLLYRNNQAQMELKGQLRKLRGFKPSADKSILNASCIAPASRDSRGPSLKSNPKKIQMRSSSSAMAKHPPRTHYR